MFPVEKDDLVNGRGGKGVDNGLGAKLPHEECVRFDLIWISITLLLVHIFHLLFLYRNPPFVPLLSTYRNDRLSIRRQQTVRHNGSMYVCHEGSDEAMSAAKLT